MTTCFRLKLLPCKSHPVCVTLRQKNWLCRIASNSRKLQDFRENACCEMYGCFHFLCNFYLISSFGGLDDACWPLVPKFTGSNAAEAVGFFRAKKSPARLPSEGK
jgi:hypothetical protein